MWIHLWIRLLLLISISLASKRSLKAELNPGCKDLCSNSTTFHLTAEGSDDVIHYLWDFIGHPSILVAVTSKTAELNIHWENYLSHKVHSVLFTEEPFYSFGLIVDKIIEFNDIDDNGLPINLNESSINRLDTKFFNWKRQNMINVENKLTNKHYVELEMSGINYTDAINNISRAGSVEIILNGFDNLERSDVTPHMLHTENSTQIDFIINDLQLNSTFKNKSRFGIELIIINPYNKSMFIDEEKNIDDEYSSGVFKSVKVNIPFDNKDVDRAYLKWREVAYLSPDRDMSNSTKVNYYPLINCSKMPYDSIVYNFYGDSNYLKIDKLNVTIGESKDGFYNKTSYASWTLLMGYGIPPQETFSYFVILIISIGVGLPGIVFIAAATYFCIKRISRK